MWRPHRRTDQNFIPSLGPCHLLIVGAPCSGADTYVILRFWLLWAILLGTLARQYICVFVCSLLHSCWRVEPSNAAILFSCMDNHHTVSDSGHTTLLFYQNSPGKITSHISTHILNFTLRHYCCFSSREVVHHVVLTYTYIWLMIFIIFLCLWGC